MPIPCSIWPLWAGTARPSAAPLCSPAELEGKLWFCTNNQKDVYKDMQADPEIEISVSSPE